MKYGDFSSYGDEYIIKGDSLSTPWRNLAANDNYLAYFSHCGQDSAAYKGRQLLGNSNQLNRSIYLRNNDSEQHWNLLTEGKDFFQVKHKPGSTQVECSQNDIEAAIQLSVHPENSYEIWRITLKNNSKSKLRLSLFPFTRLDQASSELSVIKAQGQVLTKITHGNEVVTYFAIDHVPDSYDCRADSFFGQCSTDCPPEAVRIGKCARSSATSRSGVAAFQRNITLGAGATSVTQVVFGALEVATDRTPAQRFSQACKRVEKIIEQVRTRNYNEELSNQLSKKQQQLGETSLAQTPEPNLDRVYNYWYNYQLRAISSRQSEPLLAALPFNADGVKDKIETYLKAQLKDGSQVEPNSTTADHPATVLPLTLLETVIAYIKETGELDYLRKSYSYYDGGVGSVLEHLIRASNYCIEALNKGSNEFVNHFSIHCRTYAVLRGLIPILERTNEDALVKRYERAAQHIQANADKTFWDGGWYRSRINPTIGSAKHRQHQIDLVAQAWALTSGLAANHRRERVVRSVTQKLVSAAGLSTLWPPYTVPLAKNDTSNNLPGLRDNGGINIRTALHFIAGVASMGQGNLAIELINQHLGISNSKQTAGSEPYAVNKYLFGPAHPDAGKADQSWDLSNSALAHQVILEHIFGLQPQLRGLKINPCLPTTWRRAEISRKFRGADYHIRIENPFGVSQGIDRIIVDGLRIAGNVVSPYSQGTHYIEVILG